MNTELRLLLLVIGAVIIAVVGFDFYRKRRRNYNYVDYFSGTDVENTEREVVSDQEHEVEPHDYHQNTPEKYSPDQPNTIDSVFAFDEIELVNIHKPVPKNITIHILSRDPEGFYGDELRKALASAHLYFGKNDIFHRHTREDGSGEILFSVLKSVEPGHFYINLLGRERVPGITLLLLPDEVKDYKFAIDQMVRTAKQLAFVLNGEMLDSERRHLTMDKIEQLK